MKSGLSNFVNILLILNVHEIFFRGLLQEELSSIKIE
jgi:membrane protease YdiL (CAAX protease family)